MSGEDLKRLPLVRQIHQFLGFAEGFWFDMTRRVDTLGVTQLEELTLVGNGDGSFYYLPVRAASARSALAALPIRNYQDYTFVDFGSGKGKMLFIAAEYPFRHIQGVEFATELHLQAEANIRRYRRHERKCTLIESLNVDAGQYTFPDENLVLYFFNPFGCGAMDKVLANLDASLRKVRRDVFIILMSPEVAALPSTMHRFGVVEQNRRYHIYRIPHDREPETRILEA